MSLIFPEWTNRLPTMGLAGAVVGALGVIGGVWYWATPKFWEVGYMPTQPGGGFSHQIHAGKLGMDCLYCHTFVDESHEANIPPTSVCFGCHAEGKLKPDLGPTEKVSFIRDAIAAGDRFAEVAALEAEGHWDEAAELMHSFKAEGLAVIEGGASIEWRRVHKLPDYVMFPHSVHVDAGVSCYSCHGQITGQPVVNQVEPLSMSWCLDCHRNPEPQLVPPDRVTDLVWAEAALSSGEAIAGVKELTTTPPEHCGACHY